MAMLLAPDSGSVTVDGDREVMAGRFTVTVGSGQPGTGVPGQSAGFVNTRRLALPR